MLARVSSALVPGISTRDLDEIAARELRARGARSTPRHCYGFPGSACFSANNDLAHGIPGNRVLREGDLVNIDVLAEINGYFANTGASFLVGQGSANKRRSTR